MCSSDLFMANDGTSENIISQANAVHIALSCPANILELASYIEELEAGRIAARNEALEEVANLYDWPETAKAIRALKTKENEHE